MDLNRQELNRYSRHLLLPDIGIEGQKKLKDARVLVIGAGGLGIPSSLYLAAAGVGTIGIVDFDQIESSNLQRQIIYRVGDLGKKKVDMLTFFIQSQNPFVNILKYDTYIDSSNAMEIIAGFDMVIDGTDNFPTRYLLNDCCIFLNKPYIYGSIFRFEGQISVFNVLEEGIRSCNYRDLFPNPPDPDLVPNCADGGVLGVLPGIIGSLQALEAIKIITKNGEILANQLLIFDALNSSFQKFRLRKRKDNPLTGENPSIFNPIDYQEFCNASRDTTIKIQEIEFDKLRKWNKSGKKFQLVDVREPFEHELNNLGGELMPLSNISEHIEKIKIDIPVVFHCRSGSRSRKAIKQLHEIGIKGDFYNLAGGIEAVRD